LTDLGCLITVTVSLYKKNYDYIVLANYFLGLLMKFVFLVLVFLQACALFSQGLVRPNIVVILTDQERYPMHWPKGWVEEHLPSQQRLKKHGLTFERAYIAASECSPSRAALLTSQFSPVNQVPMTLTGSGEAKPLPSKRKLLNLGALIREMSDYEVVWKGKWHLSYPVDGINHWSQKDIKQMENEYGPLFWNPPDAGTAIGGEKGGLLTLGGGFADNDGRYVSGNSLINQQQVHGWGESAIDYLNARSRTLESKNSPFCLFISLVNPHDIGFYPKGWEEGGYNLQDFQHLGIELPANDHDDLKNKPSVQLKVREAYDHNAPLPTLKEKLEYVNFYAYLHKVVDKHIMDILDALETNQLLEDTIIIRTADHGELGLSHGMREKSYTAYEEVIHVPFIISNPKLFPQPKSTNAFYSHLDFSPTIADLIGISLDQFSVQGVSQAPVIFGKSNSVRDTVIFAYDDVFVIPSNTRGGHIRSIRKEKWVYSVYFSLDDSQLEYELYDLEKDPGQLNNLAFGKPQERDQKVISELHEELVKILKAEKSLPEGVLPFFEKKSQEEKM